MHAIPTALTSNLCPCFVHVPITLAASDRARNKCHTLWAATPGCRVAMKWSDTVALPNRDGLSWVASSNPTRFFLLGSSDAKGLSPMWIKHQNRCWATKLLMDEVTIVSQTCALNSCGHWSLLPETCPQSEEFPFSFCSFYLYSTPLCQIEYISVHKCLWALPNTETMWLLRSKQCMDMTYVISKHTL